MAAFERVKSGIESMDKAFDNIRLGDNVVWEVTDLDEFRIFLDPYVKQAIKDKRNLIYFRFASHKPLVEEREGVKVIHVELSHRFETFTVEIHKLIEKEGYDAFYVFDCLSELQTAWSTDLMMGNFFRVTCPYLFSLDTVAFFPLIRGKHSFKAIAKIRDTTQLFLDVYSDGSLVFVRPVKVWNRHSDTMFLPHLYDRETGEFAPVMEGIMVSRFYQIMNSGDNDDDRNMDSWDRFFNTAIQMHKQGLDISGACGQMCDVMVSRDKKLRVLIKENFEPEDYFRIRSRMIGTGMIGGKACGMLLARKLIQNKRPDLYAKIEPHDSFYIGSDVFYAFIVDNDFWDIRIRQRSKEEYFSLADTFADHLMKGEFRGSIREQFCQMLDYYGQDPIIVRSSSILEDGFGNAFAGKYESVFCPNVGMMEERLKAFEDAVKTVYASTMSASALDYRMRRGLAGRDEQMAILVQRVSGSRYGDVFMPCAAGVGYSYSPYRFMESIDQSAGMLRLVMGLGTGAVDRTQGSYPRLVNLDKPELTPSATSAEKHQYSQRLVDVVDLTEKKVMSRDFKDIEGKIPKYLQRLLLEHDYDAEYMFRERGQNRQVRFVSCGGIVKNKEIMDVFKGILSVIQEAYNYPVDIEYAINISEDGEYFINLLQCRPLQVAKEQGNVTMPENVSEKNIFLESRHASMGMSRAVKIDYMVYVNPVAYYQMEYNKKFKVARAIGKINWHFREKGCRLMLMVPGRICTSSPELGVPTAFADISEFDVICEVSEKRAGYMPELSYGSHIFQDLVEADILYSAVFDNAKTLRFNPGMLDEFDNGLAAYCDDAQELLDVIGIYDVSGREFMVYHDMKEEHLLCTCS